MSRPRPTFNWLFVPSPLLGPTSWGRVAAAMADLGQHPLIADPAMSTTADRDHLRPWVDQIAAMPPPANDLGTVVAAHSAACPRTPLLVSALLAKGWSVSHMLLVDGRFPDGTAFTARAHYARMLDRMVRPDDYLPPWPRWWGSLVEGLVVDPEARNLLLAEAPPIPRTWFDQACPVPDLPPTIGRGFLCFGPGYAEAAEQAFEAGWLTMRLNGDHLHQMVAPEPVAATLMAMVAGMSCGRGFPQPADRTDQPGESHDP